ncbi:MAG: hypothetical protein HYV07_20510 [Deltaproteobacteria bacterium]|nr:hypothetical protein [Deltaproteobacteria bacterium]
MILLALLVASPIPSYGGELVALSLTRPRIVDPASAAALTETTVTRSVFETLYERQAGALVPVLASGAPIVDGTRLEIPLRAGVRLHDGSVLSTGDVAEALLRLQKTDAQDLIADARAIAATQETIRVEVSGRAETFVEKLADPRASIAVRRASTLIGTGPFRPVGSTPSALTLEAFSLHREGRPFVDRLSIWSGASAIGARAMLRRGRADLLIDGDGRQADVLYVLVAPMLSRDPSRLEALSAAIPRELICRRFVEGGRPVSTLLLALESQGAGRLELPATRLLFTDDRGRIRELVDRVQLDLVRAGIPATATMIDPEALDARRRERAPSLILDVMALRKGPPLERLRAIAARYGAMGSFDASRPIAELERALRVVGGLVPIAMRSTGTEVSGELEGFEVDDSGAPRFEDVRLPSARAR